MKRVELFKLLCRVIAPDGHGEPVADSEHDRSLLSDENVWPILVQIAGEGLVTPTLAGALQRKRVYEILPPDARQYLEGVQALNRDRNAILKEELLRIVATLNRIGIEPVLLKGAINLVSRQYPGSEDRLMGDLDLLVPLAQAQEAWIVLLKNGYRTEKGETPDFGDQSHHHAPPLLHVGEQVSVELHWGAIIPKFQSLLPCDWIRRECIPLDWNGSQIQLPGPATRVLMTFAHAQLQDMGHLVQYLSLRSLLEFAWQVRMFEEQIDWDELGRALKRANGGKHLGAWLTWLHASGSLFGSDIPGSFAPCLRDRWALQEMVYSMNSMPAQRLLFQKRRLRIGLKRRFRRWQVNWAVGPGESP